MKRSLRFLVIALAPLATGACSWLTDFRQQPSVSPWQSLSVDWTDTTTPFRGNPQNSVPTTGAVAPAYQISYAKMPATIDSFSTFANPVPATQESVDRGWKYFQVNCAVCHGTDGGSSPVAKSFMIFAPSLLEAITKNRTDGYIFGMIRNGRATMPSMNRVEEMDRWHIVNYLRGLQGSLPASITVRKEAPGLPGETGETLPGATMTAPTRSAPYTKPAYTPTGGKAAPPHEEKKGGEHK